MADKTPDELKAEADAAQKQAEQDRRDIAAGEPVPISMTMAGKEPDPATDRIRAFEDEHLGKDAVRINGQVEQGHGSLFKSLSPAHLRHYAALEKLATAEAKLNVATSALAEAKAEHAGALAQADDSEIEPEPPVTEKPLLQKA